MFSFSMRFRVFILSALLPFCGVASLYDFNINVTFGSGMDESYKSAFSNAASFWESQITGYRIDNAALHGITISANVAARDGVGGVLSSAGPTQGYFLRNVQLAGDSLSSDVLYATAGAITFDSADVDDLISRGFWDQVILHEMAHVIGFGTLWGFNYAGTIYNNFYVAGSGQYTGAAGLAAYREEFDPNASYVPVELDGGAGTANGHWDETYGGTGLTGITDTNGNDMANALMTGWLNTPTFVSKTTVAQFYDLGYTVIPEPTPLSMIALVSAGALWLRRRLYC